MSCNIVATQPLHEKRPDLQTSGRDPYPNIDCVTNELIAAVEASDARPWLKACEECVFRDSMQRNSYLQLCAETHTHFYCIHRLDSGENRVCAGHAAFLKAQEQANGNEHR